MKTASGVLSAAIVFFLAVAVGLQGRDPGAPPPPIRLGGPAGQPAAGVSPPPAADAPPPAGAPAPAPPPPTSATTATTTPSPPGGGLPNADVEEVESDVDCVGSGRPASSPACPKGGKGREHREQKR